jgi:uncharacterized membrane protein YfcA
MFMTGFWVGIAAGFMGGLVGVGGGVIMTPLMTEILKFKQREAHGTSLVAVVFTALAASVVYYAHGSVDIMVSILLAALALTTVRLGARYCNVLPEYLLKRYYGVLLLFVAILLFAKPYLPHIIDANSPIWLRWGLLVIIGVITGFISGMMGVGGGTFMVPMMVLFIGIRQVDAQGISLLSMIPASALGAWTHWKMGNVKTQILAGLVAGVLLGAYSGGSFAHCLPENTLRVVFALLLIYSAMRYLKAKPAPTSHRQEKDAE